MGSITGVSGKAEGPPCAPGMMGGVSILRFGRSLPLVELFETFMVVGMVLIMLATAVHFTFVNISAVLSADNISPKGVIVANAAAKAQPVWIGIGVVMFILGVIMYYFDRRVVSAPP